MILKFYSYFVITKGLQNLIKYAFIHLRYWIKKYCSYNLITTKQNIIIKM